jgi:hypothetical protein
MKATTMCASKRVGLVVNRAESQAAPKRLERLFDSGLRLPAPGRD